MEQDTLIKLVLREARRDCINMKGRIFKSQILRTLQISNSDFNQAINKITKENHATITQAPLNPNIYYFQFNEPLHFIKCACEKTNKQT